MARSKVLKKPLGNYGIFRALFKCGFHYILKSLIKYLNEYQW